MGSKGAQRIRFEGLAPGGMAGFNVFGACPLGTTRSAELVLWDGRRVNTGGRRLPPGSEDWEIAARGPAAPFLYG